MRTSGTSIHRFDSIVTGGNALGERWLTTIGVPDGSCDEGFAYLNGRMMSLYKRRRFQLASEGYPSGYLLNMYVYTCEEILYTVGYYTNTGRDPTFALFSRAMNTFDLHIVYYSSVAQCRSYNDPSLHRGGMKYYQ